MSVEIWMAITKAHHTVSHHTVWHSIASQFIGTMTCHVIVYRIISRNAQTFIHTLSTLSIFAPLSMSSFTVVEWPYREAHISAERQSWQVMIDICYVNYYMHYLDTGRFHHAELLPWILYRSNRHPQRSCVRSQESSIFHSLCRAS